MTDTAAPAVKAEEKPKVELPPIAPIVVTRAETPIELSVQSDNKGLGKGNPFMGFSNVEEIPLATIEKWVDNEGWIKKGLISKMNKVFKEVFADVFPGDVENGKWIPGVYQKSEDGKTNVFVPSNPFIGDDGLFSNEKFALKFNAAMNELKFISEKLKEMKARLDVLTAEAVQIAESGAADAWPQIQEKMAQISALKKDIEAKSRKPSLNDDGDDDDAAPATV